MELINLYLSSIPDIAKDNSMFVNPLNGRNGNMHVLFGKVNHRITYIKNFVKNLFKNIEILYQSLYQIIFRLDPVLYYYYMTIS